MPLGSPIYSALTSLPSLSNLGSSSKRSNDGHNIFRLLPHLFDRSRKSPSIILTRVESKHADATDIRTKWETRILQAVSSANADRTDMVTNTEIVAEIICQLSGEGKHTWIFGGIDRGYLLTDDLPVPQCYPGLDRSDRQYQFDLYPYVMVKSDNSPETSPYTTTIGRGVRALPRPPPTAFDADDAEENNLSIQYAVMSQVAGSRSQDIDFCRSIIDGNPIAIAQWRDVIKSASERVMAQERFKDVGLSVRDTGKEHLREFGILDGTKGVAEWREEQRPRIDSRMLSSKP